MHTEYIGIISNIWMVFCSRYQRQKEIMPRRSRWLSADEEFKA
jgi:hypothetical protein